MYLLWLVRDTIIIMMRYMYGPLNCLLSFVVLSQSVSSSMSTLNVVVTHVYSHLYSHGEALTFEPLLMREEESVLRDFAVLAIATVTQAIFLTLTPKLEPLTSLTLKVAYTVDIH